MEECLDVFFGSLMAAIKRKDLVRRGFYRRLKRILGIAILFLLSTLGFIALSPLIIMFLFLKFLDDCVDEALK